MNSSLGTSSRPHGQPKMKLALAPRRSRSPARNPPPAPKTPTRNKEPTREHKRSFPIAQRKTTNPPPVTNAPTRKKKPQGEHKSPFPIAQRKNTNLPLRPSTPSPSPSPSTGKGGNKSLTTSMVGNLIRRRADAVVDSGNPSSAIKRRRAQPRRRYKEATLYTFGADSAASSLSGAFPAAGDEAGRRNRARRAAPPLCRLFPSHSL